MSPVLSRLLFLENQSQLIFKKNAPLNVPIGMIHFDVDTPTYLAYIFILRSLHYIQILHPLYEAKSDASWRDISICETSF